MLGPRQSCVECAHEVASQRDITGQSQSEVSDAAGDLRDGDPALARWENEGGSCAIACGREGFDETSSRSTSGIVNWRRARS
jgi:hypothetical protein